MTIAAGLLYEGGVLMMADTLMSADTISIYQSKLMVHNFSDGKAVFGLAGNNVNLAESAVQECEAPLTRYEGKPRTFSQIAKVIRDALARHYKTHVIDNQLQFTHYYNVVIAIYSSVDGVGLYVTDMTVMKRTRRGFECAGSGHDLAHYLIGPLYDRSWTKEGKRISEERAQTLLYYAMANIRAFMPGSVGGDPILVEIQNDGLSHAIGTGESYQVMDNHLRRYGYYTGTLLLSLFSTLTDEEFSKSLDGFVSATKQLRDLWKADLAAVTKREMEVGVPLSRIELEVMLNLAAPKRPRTPQRDQKSPSPGAR
jgi:hypothetical protein